MNNSSQTRRPLGNSTALGYPIAISGGSPTIIHEYDSSSVQNGGPYTDTVTVYVSNKTGSDLTVNAVIGSGSDIEVTVPANETVTLFDGIPTRGVAGTPTYLQAQGSQTGLVAFGWFTRA